MLLQISAIGSQSQRELETMSHCACNYLLGVFQFIFSAFKNGVKLLQKLHMFEYYDKFWLVESCVFVLLRLNPPALIRKSSGLGLELPKYGPSRNFLTEVTDWHGLFDALSKSVGQQFEHIYIFGPYLDAPLSIFWQTHALLNT